VATLFNAFPITTNYEYPANLANTTNHSCIRGYPDNAFLITTNYEHHPNLAPKTYHSCIRGYLFNALPITTIYEHHPNLAPKTYHSCIPGAKLPPAAYTLKKTNPAKTRKFDSDESNQTSTRTATKSENHISNCSRVSQPKFNPAPLKTEHPHP